MTIPLRRRGLISDQAGAALIAADGTIDWWCPAFEARPALAALLDPTGAVVRTGPALAAPSGGDQRYEPDTNVLRTTIVAAGGTLEIADFLPWAGPGHTPRGGIVRVLTALAGRMDVAVEVEPGRDGWSEGVAGPGFAVWTGFAMHAVPGERPVWRGTTTLEAGQRLVMTIDPATDRRDRPQPLSVGDALQLLGDTESAWRSQLAGAVIEGAYQAAAHRSLVAIRALTASAGGGLIAAPTASLPEQPGGERNFDGRVCWTADAARAADVLARAGLESAAADHRDWLAGVLRGGDLPLPAAHATEGGPPPEEEEVGWAGFLGSQPVRFGWTAPDQPDFAGMAAVLVHGDPDLAWAESVALAGWLAEAWANAPAPLVADQLAVAAALDRLSAAARRKNPLDLDAAGWWQEARRIRAWVEDNGIAAGGGLRRDTSPADLPDAGLLAVTWLGPWPADHPVTVKTVERVLDRLGQGPALVEAYPPEFDDGLPPGRPPTMPASFTAVRALATLGRWEEAHARMEVLIGLTGPLGLAGGAADPRTGVALGNYPSAAAHLALVDAALALAAGPR